jgi:hypothetical protein
MGLRVFWIEVERIDGLKAIRFPGGLPWRGKVHDVSYETHCFNCILYEYDAWLGKGR